MSVFDHLKAKKNAATIKSQARAQVLAEAQTVADICSLAGVPETAGEYLAQGVDASQVRKELFQRSGDTAIYSDLFWARLSKRYGQEAVH